MTLSETARSPWSSRQVASGGLLGSFRAWSGSASCCLRLAEGKASLVRSASLDACPLALPALFVSGLIPGRVELGSSFGNLFSVWTCRLT